MRQRVLASALLALVVAACGGEGKITEPQRAPAQLKALAAIGTDPNTGATIETNKDDYAPGEVVHLTGRGWTPNETVQLFMTEDPDTHGDVSQEVRADSIGAFTLHFYDVQTHDLGVTFTLTATGQTSGSSATAVFTDGNLNVSANSLPNSAGSRVFSPNGDGSLDQATLDAAITGPGSETNVLIDIRTGSLITGTSVRTVGPAVSYNPPPNSLAFSRVWDGKDNSSVDVAEGVYTARIYSTSQPLGTSEVTGARRVQLLVDRTAPVVSAALLAPSTTTPGASVTFTATATDALTRVTEAEYRIGAGPWLPMAAAVPPFDALSEALTVTFTAPTAGTYNVCARARDLGLTWSNGTTCATLLVENPNQAPTANAGGPYLGTEGTAVLLSGLGSDPDGGAVSFAWSVAPNDGTCVIASPSSQNTSVTCSDNGAWTLTLTVTDDENTASTSDAALTVANVAPTINVHTAGGNVNEGSSIGFAVSNVTDPSTVDAAAGFTYAFACDGTTFGAFGASSTVNCPAGDGPGSVTIAAQAKDKDGGISTTVSSTFTVVNVAPTATFNAPSPVNEGSPISLSLTSPADPSSADVAAGFTYAFDCGSGYGAFSGTNSASCPTNDNGLRAVKGKIRDKDNGVTEYSASVTINNVAPTATFNAPTSVIEGSPINLSLTGPFDPSSVDVAAGFEYAFDCGDGAGYSVYGAASTRSCPTTDDGTRSVQGKIRDKDGGETAYTASVTVTNAAPEITLITVPPAPISVGSPVTVSWDFTDPGADTWQCKISWDQPISYGPLFASDADGTPKTCSATTSALPAGIYTVTVYVRDDDGGEDYETATAYIVVYDPSAGFVTGGGWINSPLGAYVPSPSLTGKANFGFVSKYKKGQTVPDGNTEFQFHAGNLNFKSAAYEWLVVSGARAQFKGTGTINGAGNFGFMLSAIDGQVSGGGGTDKFRMKIWNINPDGTEGSVVYDNQLGGGVDDAPTTALGGGSINIQAK